MASCFWLSGCAAASRRICAWWIRSGGSRRAKKRCMRSPWLRMRSGRSSGGCWGERLKSSVNQGRRRFKRSGRRCRWPIPPGSCLASCRVGSGGCGCSDDSGVYFLLWLGGVRRISWPHLADQSGGFEGGQGVGGMGNAADGAGDLSPRVGVARLALKQEVEDNQLGGRDEMQGRVAKLVDVG